VDARRTAARIAVPDTVESVDRLLGDCSPGVLRRRRSWKWTEYPPDVIPAWVAEMDFDLAEPIKDAVRQAITAGDCGYPHPIGLGEAYAEFAFLDRGRVAVTPGADFGDPGRGFVRLNMGTSPELLAEIVRRMGAAADAAPALAADE
jgi:bifunctional pyridoxal-dependent enzyme with beta-cystathionase and maltose regulon repressor activities